ncbi:MAG: hypothetical protein OJF48_004503 [Afipia sp.]|jgi:hypothetical protein|nr:MAG: hypothetical protein OJF48_004503 [Afipia sp.]
MIGVLFAGTGGENATPRNATADSNPRAVDDLNVLAIRQLKSASISQLAWSAGGYAISFE